MIGSKAAALVIPQSKKARAFIASQAGVLTLFEGLPPLVSAICFTVITCVYLLAQAIADRGTDGRGSPMVRDTDAAGAGE